jgi:hypothetical protein
MKSTESRSPMGSAVFVKTKPRYGHSLWQKLQHLWQLWLNHLKTEELEFRIWFTHDGIGKTWWSAENLRTGRAIFDVSEDHIRRWLEEQQR